MSQTLDPIQLSLWPSLRAQLILAAGAQDSKALFESFSRARLQGLSQFAKEDLSWQVEAFILGEDTPPRWIVERASWFERNGLNWSALAPLVFDESSERLESALRSPEISLVYRKDPDLARSSLSLVFFLACVGVGPFPERALVDQGASFRSACRGLDQLDQPRRARAAATLKAFQQDETQLSFFGQIDNSVIFTTTFGERPWGEDCRRWGSKTDFTREIDRLVEVCALEASAAPASAPRAPSRI